MTIVDASGEHHVPLGSKDEVAEAILDRVGGSSPAAARARPCMTRSPRTRETTTSIQRE